MSLASSSAWRDERKAGDRGGGTGSRSVAAPGRRRSSARGVGDGEGEGRRRGASRWRDAANARRVGTRGVAGRRRGWARLGSAARVRRNPRRASPSRWRARAARGSRDGARVPRARRVRRVAHKPLEEPSRCVPRARVGVRARRRRDQPRGRRAGRRRRRPRRRAARFDFLAAPGRARAGKRGRARRAPGWPRLPRRPMRTCWKWRECAVDATRGFGRWARRCVGARHASNSLFNTFADVSSPPGVRCCCCGSADARCQPRFEIQRSSHPANFEFAETSIPYEKRSLFVFYV